jgi:hypothetical protein
VFPASIALNEILPEPQTIDWNQDGGVTYEDEWIELYNLGATPVSLGGWAVADATRTFTIPHGTMIWPHGYLTLFRTQTRLALGDDRESITLIQPDGRIADSYAYTIGPGPDRSYCRSNDGTGAWSRGCQPTPGGANRLAPPTLSPTATTPPEQDSEPARRRASPTPLPRLISILEARQAPDGAQVMITGSVTMPPGPLSQRIYVEDTTAGIGVYLRRGDFPGLELGDVVRVTGQLTDYHGEAQIEVSSPSRVVRLGPGTPLTPRRLRTRAVEETNEGRLVWVAGRVIQFTGDSITLDDGSGPARVYFPAGLTWPRPYVRIGEIWAVQGVVGQYAARPPYIGGYQLIPRLPADVSRAPLFLPVTGARDK